MHRPGIIGARPHHGGGGYVGPLDIVPGAVFLFDQRAASAATRGAPLYSIADGAGGSTQSFNSDGATGLAPVSAIGRYSSSPFVALWNDLSGNGYDAAQAVGINQPAWTASGVNGKPALQFTGSSPSGLSNASVAVPSGGVTFVIVLQRATTPAFGMIQAALAANPNDELFFAANNDVEFQRWNAGIPDASTTSPTSPGPSPLDGAAHVIFCSVDASGHNVSIDGVEQDMANMGFIDLTAITFPLYIGDDAPASSPDIPYTGLMAAMGLWPTRITGTSMSALIQNYKDAFGVP